MKAFSYEQAYLFNIGSDLMSYNLLGSHYFCENDIEGYTFCCWAPNAVSVHVAGDFNRWDTMADEMTRMGDTGMFWCRVEGASIWDNYKYFILDKEGNHRFKADPYAFHSETRPGNSSKLYPLNDGFPWSDFDFIDKRYEKNRSEPINIYEVHLGSWKKNSDGEFHNYRVLAHELGEYVKKMGYTHIELLPVMEHPLDDSWGYQVTSFYCPTPRFGTPADFKYFVNHMHSLGIGVFLDWVPGHFPKDDFALSRFDGSALFEYEDDRLGEHKEWGTYVFNYARSEVRSFLISNAYYWIKEFHIDGLRVDAVSSMLYLNYGRENHTLNKYGGVENLDAISFLQSLNTAIHKDFPSVLMMAEESTAWAGVTAPVSDGGLGFDYKWNMGWMHDTLGYFSRDYIYRKWHHNQLSFSMVYAFSENYILPLSHDEVVHGKKSLIDKMPGDIWRKFASLKTLFTYMIAHPGVKLSFMGNEFGQFIEWRFYEQLEWFLLEYENHSKLQLFVQELNHLYLENAALWENDKNWDGFTWNISDDSHNSVYAFTRKSKGREIVLAVLNMTPSVIRDYRIGVISSSDYKMILNSDDLKYGGSGFLDGISDKDTKVIKAKKSPYNQFKYSIVLDIPPNAGMLFSSVKDEEKQKKVK